MYVSNQKLLSIFGLWCGAETQGQPRHYPRHNDLSEEKSKEKGISLR
jgi:hypothetical protein